MGHQRKKATKNLLRQSIEMRWISDGVRGPIQKGPACSGVISAGAIVKGRIKRGRPVQGLFVQEHLLNRDQIIRDKVCFPVYCVSSSEWYRKYMNQSVRRICLRFLAYNFWQKKPEFEQNSWQNFNK
jgi:hypothetical protein